MRAERVISLLLMLTGLAMAGCAAAQMDSKPRPAAYADTPMSPSSSATAEGAFEAAWAKVDAGQFTEGERAFQVWLSVYGQPGNPRTPRAMFWLAYCQEKLGRADSAVKTYVDLQQKFPASEAAKLARQRASQLHAQ